MKRHTLGVCLAVAVIAAAPPSTARAQKQPVAAATLPPLVQAMAITFRVNGSAVAISWPAVAGAGVQYRLLRSTDSLRAFADLTPPMAVPAFTDATVARGVLYFYQVVAQPAGGRAIVSPPTRFMMPAAVIGSGGMVALPMPDRPAGPPATGDGPAPTALRVTAYDPALQLINWSVPQSFTGAEVWRKTSNALAWAQVNKASVTIGQVNDTTFLPADGATYRVVVHYANGKTGVADVPFTTPARPAGITELYGKQNDAEGSVGLWWKPVDKAQGYRIFGPGQPAAGKLVKGAIDTVTGVPRGDATFRVAPVYTAAVPGVPEKTYTQHVYPRVARYRVTLLGFRANQATVDDPLQRDGKGDEVFVAASVVRLEMTPNLAAYVYKGAVASLKTPVYGDVNGFPNRVRAGSLSAQGGIKAGDSYPADPSAPKSAPLPNALPLLLLDATLTYNKDIYVIAPSIWEWDGDPSEYNGWANNLVTSATSPVGLSHMLLRDAIGNPTILPDWYFIGTDNKRGSLSMNTSPGKDRAIGLQPGGYGDLSLYDLAYTISQERLERAFEKAGTTRIIVGQTWDDYRPAGDCGLLCGNYSLWLQFERVP